MPWPVAPGAVALTLFACTAPSPSPIPREMPAAPGIPTNLRVADRGRDFIEWAWDPVSGAAGYQVQISVGDDDFNPPDEQALLPANETAARYEDEALTPETAVLLRVRAFGGSSAAPAYGPFSAPVSGTASGGPPSTSPATDRAALEALYRATAGPGWHDNTGWLTGVPLNEWYGVQTDPAGRVTALNLAYNQLDGVIPPELGQLSNLIRLDLQENSLTGPIPPELGQLSNLTELLLGNVDLDTFIGRLGYGNELSGPIPPELGRLSNLQHLNLSGNALTGEIPPEFGRLSNLVTLDLSWNPMTGPIPEELTQIPTLERVWVARGMCVPSGPPFDLWLQGVDFGSRELPPPSWRCPPLLPAAERAALEALYRATAGDNWRFNWGWLSATPEHWYGVQRTLPDGHVGALWLGGNLLSGSIPPELGHLGHLARLDLSQNRLTGSIPAQLGRLTNLTELNLSDNRLSGPLPSELGRVENLVGLELQNNQLTGSIPRELGRLTNLGSLRLYGNEFGGSIPRELGQLASLTLLRLDSNRLRGPIPSELGQLSKLSWLDLSANELTGQIPPELGQLKDLQFLGLDQNLLSGPIPPELGQLVSLETLRLEGNQLSGAIPGELGQLVNLWILLLDGNQLSGRIPPELGEITYLRRLTLHDNPALTGRLPDTFLSLDLWELSLNNTGLCVPTGPAFDAWLRSIGEDPASLARCAE